MTTKKKTDKKTQIRAGWQLSDGAMPAWSHRALAPARHGFFTRKGGVSSGLYAQLNCGTASQDETAHITENRARAAAALGLSQDRLIGLRQVHGKNVITLSDEAQLAGLRQNPPEADGLVSNLAATGLAILTADCAPVLMRDEASGIIGACHAGWRGAVSGVVQQTLEAMVDLGAELANIHLAIGPTIAKDSYQIGPEMIASLEAEAPDAYRFVEHRADGYGQFDLPGYLMDIAEGRGLAGVQNLAADTYQDPALYFSHRRATHQKQPDSGRLISIITNLVDETG